MKKRAELLAPAGNFEKLKTALCFGADAVYLGGKSFSLRSFSDNFGKEELKEAVEYAHARGKKVYVTANIFAKNADFAALSDHLAYLQEIGADAALVTDAGVLALAKKVAPKLPLHISTQANTTNKYAAKFWQEQGAERVVLARELSLAEIKEIKDFCPDLELEVFVHGAMCISYSGRCLLSNYLAGRDSNRGECVQACRWKYFLRAEGKEGEIYAEEDGRGTYIFNSKDLNLSARLDELAAAGADSFKIEGRMKSAYYVATVVNAYRRLMDGKMTAEEAARELDTAAHRDYTEAYAFGNNDKTVNYADSQTAGTRIYTANVLEGAHAGGAALIEMRNRFRLGDELEILSPSDSFGRRFVVEEMRGEDGESVADAKLVQQKLRVFCPYELCAGDILRRIPKGE
ncbi:MAG TPA: U32 family peptidase [Candidatus Borkfalkia avistercoris]|uniref:U32 family peptidase n=1 Tax=Candidatus Borkfalkia avistercoris TaxID=2838504 RepID=A0A9D2CYY9_9FIRM|nr:U32 family peptidase [Candidatus Borkfalkia avistercoris]